MRSRVSSRDSRTRKPKDPAKRLAAENARLQARLDGIKQRKIARRERAERRGILQDLFNWMMKMSKKT